MDYIDQVFIEVKDLIPGKYLMSKLKDPERFIEAVKELIDDEWVNDIDFTKDYEYMVKHDFTGFKSSL